MLELIPGVSLASLKYTSYPKWDMLGSIKEEFRTGGDFPAAAWHLGGYSCFLKEGSLMFSLSAERATGIFPIAFMQSDQNGKRILSSSKDRTLEEPCATFEKSVHISFGGENTVSLRTNKHPQNLIRLLIPGIDGSWRIEEFAIVAQDDRLFLTQQRLYAGRAYRANAEATIFAPDFSHWGDSFRTMLEDAFRTCALPAEDSSRKAKLAVPPHVPEGNGVVKFYNLAQQWGSVYIHEANAVMEARLYWGHSACKRGRIVYFEPGETVAYETVVPARATHPDRPTLFKREVMTVRSVVSQNKVAESYAGC